MQQHEPGLHSPAQLLRPVPPDTEGCFSSMLLVTSSISMALALSVHTPGVQPRVYNISASRRSELG